MVYALVYSAYRVIQGRETAQKVRPERNYNSLKQTTNDKRSAFDTKIIEPTEVVEVDNVDSDAESDADEGVEALLASDEDELSATKTAFI
ncbi:hypothetical protein ACTXT7_015653 [Hymenolepis weldensis]